MAGTKRTMSRVVIMAFQGWNDAADASTTAIDFIADSFPTDLLSSSDTEEFFDYQISRPIIATNEDGVREICWPAISVELSQLPRTTLMLISGPEPNLRWRDFATWIDQMTTAFNPDLIVLLGAMLTDSPHSRPFTVAGTAPTYLAGKLELEPNDYEGPTGIIGVLAVRYGTMCPNKLVTMWVSVPHYTAPSPNPKASLALLEHLEVVLGVTLDLEEIRQDVAVWEQHIDQLLDEDPDMADYVETLENQNDAETVPKGTGDKLAAAFEDYLLRRRAQDGPSDARSL